MGTVDVVDVLRALGGSARFRDLRGRVSRRRLARAVATGAVLERRGVYSVPGASDVRVAVRALGGCASHRTAAESWGLALPPGDQSVSVMIPPKAQRRRVPREVRLHYARLSEAELEHGVTSPLHTVVDCLRDLSLREALAVGDSALHHGLVDHDELAAEVAALRGPRSAIARERLAMLDARSANAFESSCRAILLEAGLTGFRPQVNITHNGRWIGRVDLADVAGRVVIECDGWATHGSRDGWTRDVTRHTLLVAAGWRPLRFTWEQVMFEPDRVLDLVLDALALAA
jgi:very-short-patch-repair endonuclease